MQYSQVIVCAFRMREWNEVSLKKKTRRQKSAFFFSTFALPGFVIHPFIGRQCVEDKCKFIYRIIKLFKIPLFPKQTVIFFLLGTTFNILMGVLEMYENNVPQCPIKKLFCKTSTFVVTIFSPFLLHLIISIVSSVPERAKGVVITHHIAPFTFTHQLAWLCTNEKVVFFLSELPLEIVQDSPVTPAFQKKQNKNHLFLASVFHTSPS